jgi:hypothetical protein
VKQRHLIATAVEPQASIEGVRRTPLVRDDAQDKKMSTRVLVWLFRGRVSLPLAQCSRDINLVEVFWHLRSWTVGRGENCIVRYLIGALALGLATGSAEPVAAQQVKAGVLTCDVSAGMGLILGSQKLLSCRFSPEGPGRREDYDGSITKFGLDLGLTRSGVMVWAVFSNTVAGPGFLAGDYFGATGEATVGAGLGASVLLGGSNRTVALQPISLSGQTGLNLAIGVAALQLGLPRQ